MPSPGFSLYQVSFVYADESDHAYQDLALLTDDQALIVNARLNQAVARGLIQDVNVGPLSNNPMLFEELMQALDENPALAPEHALTDS